MTEIWDKESLKQYIVALIDNLEDKEYVLSERRGVDFLEIDIEPPKESRPVEKSGMPSFVRNGRFA